MSRVYGALLGLIRSFLIAKCLGPHGFGIWQFVNIFERYSGYASIGTRSAISRKIPFLRARSDIQGVRQYLTTAFTINLFSSIIYILFVIIFALVIKRDLEAQVLVAYAPVILLLSWLDYNNVLLVSMGFFSFRSRLEFLQDTLVTLLSIAFVYFFDIYGVILGFLISTFVVFTISVYNLWSQLSIKVEWQVLWDLIFTGVPIMANGLLLTMMGTIDRILIAAFLNREILGIYGVSSIGINVLRTVLASFGQMLFVKFAEMDGQDKTPHHVMSVLDRTTTILSCFVSSLICIIIVSLPITIILLLPQFASGIAAGKLLLAETFFLGISLPAANWCISTGRFISILIVRIILILLETLSIYSAIVYKLDLEFIALCVLSTSALFSLSISVIANYLLETSLAKGFIRWIRWIFPFFNIALVMWIQERYYTISVEMPMAQLLESWILGLIVSLLAILPLAFWAERRTGLIELIHESVRFFLKRRHASQPGGKMAAC
jgi:O-antigen/teichoic acid export membrane protein